MDKTTNYQLNQWDPDDKVQRTDFNADNAKIDAALAAGAAQRRDIDTRAHPILLKTWTSGEATKTLTLDISGIEWTKYAWVVLEIYMPEKTAFLMGVNGKGQFYYRPDGALDDKLAALNIPANLFRMFCPVFYRDDLPLHGFVLDSYCGISTSYLPMRELTIITLTAFNSQISDPMLSANMEFKIWGIQ